MSKNQTTALLLLAFTAFLFWLYNTGKLKQVVAIVKGSNGTQVASNTPVSQSTVGGTLPVMPVNTGNGGLITQPYNGGYQLPTLQNNSYIQPYNQGTPTLNNIGLTQSLYSIPRSDPGITPSTNNGWVLSAYDVLSALGYGV